VGQIKRKNRPNQNARYTQPHLRFDNKSMWTLDDVRGHTIKSPLVLLREMNPAQREVHLANYRAGFKINPFN
jgi:propane monooxygenase large subunit